MVGGMLALVLWMRVAWVLVLSGIESSWCLDLGGPAGLFGFGFGSRVTVSCEVVIIGVESGSFWVMSGD